MKKITKILIVDDEPQNVMLMRDILSFHPGYECRGALSGLEALASLKNYYPEIILLDVMMPGIDGYEVCKRIRIQSEHKFCKIIMISGMSMIDDRLKGYEAGADDYLTKPFVEDELLAKLQVYSKLNRMEEVDTLKTMALNILSHETRTPLNGIILGSELLREMDGLPAKAKEYVELVQESGLKIQELVEKISRYYFIKDGISKNLSENSLSSVMSCIISDIGLLEELKKVLFDCEDNIKFIADWGLLKEAIRYVIDNSIKNSPESGGITISCWKNGPQIFIEVGDQGPGMEPSMTERVFDGLVTTDLLHHRQGTGLSLAIAKEIIEEHEGRISARNREGGGTLFQITLKDQTSEYSPQ
jgi:two-component system sensor histidine kinase/response regulator